MSSSATTTSSSSTPSSSSTASSTFASFDALKVATLDELLKAHQGQLAHPMLAMVNDQPVPTLDDMLGNQDKAPSSTSVVLVPEGTLTSDDRECLEGIRLLEAYITGAASRYLYGANPKGWDISDPAQAYDWNRKSAEARFRILTQGLPTVLNWSTSTNSNFSKNTTSVDLHFEFLGTLFNGFGFSKDVMDQLDAVLNSVANKLRSLQASWSEQREDLAHIVGFHYSTPIQGSDLRDWKYRLFYLHISQHSWSLSIGKSSVAHFDFSMNWYDNVSVLNFTQLKDQKDAIQKLVTSMGTKSLEDIEKITTPKAVQEK